MSRVIPGSQRVKGREFLYIQSPSDESFSQLIDAALRTCTSVPAPRSGGAIEEKVQVTVETAVRMIGISYKGDIEGWRAKFVAFCGDSGRTYGFIRNSGLALSTGTTLPLAELEFTFDQ